MVQFIYNKYINKNISFLDYDNKIVEKKLSNNKTEISVENNNDITTKENLAISIEKKVDELVNNNKEKKNSLVSINEENFEVESPTTRIDSIEQSIGESSPQFRPAEEAEFLNKSTKSIPVSSGFSELQTPQPVASSSKQKHISYEITPDKVHLPSTRDNYVIDDLSSADETDSEEAPRKDIPKWAQS